MNNIQPSQLIFGAFFLVLGLGLLLQQLIPGLDFNIFELVFPGLMTLAGISIIYRHPQKFILGSILIFLGLAWGVNNILDLSFIQFWPVVFILIGVSILFGKTEHHHSKTGEYSEGVGLSEDIIFWGLQKRVVGEFKKGEINAIFGGAEIDMTEAKISDDAQLECNAIFGGISLRVPKDVKVVTSGTGIFGGFSDKSRSVADGSQKTLHITGAAIFGGVEIKE